MASMTSELVIGMVRGRPAMRSRPRTSIVQLALERQRRADGDLDLFGRPLADHQVVLAADVAGDGLVEAVAADAQRAADDDAAERDDRDLASCRRRCR